MPSPALHATVRLSSFRQSAKNLIVALALCGAIGTSHAGETAQSTTHYADVAAAINSTMRAHHYNPAELDTPAYREIEGAISRLGQSASSDQAFMEGFERIWEAGPFSHVTIGKARQSADELAGYLDTMRVGGGGASLTWRDDVAVLTVTTMMGLDTIEEIDAAYAAIIEGDASGLIIDLRENGGGAFAVRPLVSHLLAEPVDAGAFVSRPWNASHDRAPASTDLDAVEPWEGWSIRSFWNDVTVNPITRISFSPTEPVFSGPVFVLTSKRTASAAELATDALRVANRVTIVGEMTAGEMLSQSIFDIPGGFQLSLPIADYYSMASGRIEGVGIAPEVETDAASALDTALEMLDRLGP